MNSFYKSQLSWPGFLLIELCVTIACLGFIGAGICFFYSQALTQEAAAYKKLKALQITQLYYNEIQTHKKFNSHETIRESYKLRATVLPTRIRNFFYLTLDTFENNQKISQKPLVSLVTGVIW